MKIIQKEQLNNILIDKVLHREIIDKSKHGRIIERLRLSSKSLLLKYGTDYGIQNEVMIYQRIGPKTSKVPHVILSEKIEGIYFLVLNWIEGTHPNFKNPQDILKVYTALGSWAAEWSKRIDELIDIKYDSLNAFDKLEKLLSEREDALKEIINSQTLDQLKYVIQKQDYILKKLRETPLSLDPGDISLHNTIISSDDGNVIFIDFETSSIRPMVMFFEHFGEGYESIPSTPKDIDLAKRSFLNAWNDSSNSYIEWDCFLHNQICRMIYYKICNHIYWIQRILNGRSVEETTVWINNDSEKLRKLIVNLEAGDVV